MTPMVPLLDGIAPPGNSFVVPDKKLVYIATTKAACTSLRWMVADLAGEDPADFHSAIAAHQTRLMTIHTTRSTWRHTPQLGGLPRTVLEQVSPDNGWFVFAVVRDPWTRFWSAWQSKFLVRQSYYARNYGDEPWFPRVPSSTEEVLEDFQAFVRARPWTTNERLAGDFHFRPQVESVHPGQINYTRVYDVRELGTLFDDLKQHLGAVGAAQDHLYVPRANETPLPMIEEVLTDEYVQFVRERYAEDLRAFADHGWSPESVKTVPGPWSPEKLELIAFHTVANERLRDLSEAARKLRSQLNHTREQNTALRAQLQQGSAPRAASSAPGAAPAARRSAARSAVRSAAPRVRQAVHRLRRRVPGNH